MGRMTIELASKTFAFTGNTSTSRKDLAAKLAAKGGKVSASIEKSTNYLVKGDKPNAGHLLRAKSLRVKVVSEKQLMGALAGIVKAKVAKKPAVKKAPAEAKPAKKALSAAEKRDVDALCNLARDSKDGKVPGDKLEAMVRALPRATQDQNYWFSERVLGATKQQQLPLVPLLFEVIPSLKKPRAYARLLLRLGGDYSAEQQALLLQVLPLEDRV